MNCLRWGSAGPNQAREAFYVAETSGKGDFHCGGHQVPVPPPVEGKGGWGESTCPVDGRLIVPLVGKPNPEGERALMF